MKSLARATILHIPTCLFIVSSSPLFHLVPTTVLREYDIAFVSYIFEPTEHDFFANLTKTRYLYPVKQQSRSIAAQTLRKAVVVITNAILMGEIIMIITALKVTRPLI